MPRAFKGACTKREGCVKVLGHRGSCKVAVMEEVDYEVEDILEERTGDTEAAAEAYRSVSKAVHVPQTRAHVWHGCG